MKYKEKLAKMDPKLLKIGKLISRKNNSKIKSLIKKISNRVKNC